MSNHEGVSPVDERSCLDDVIILNDSFNYYRNKKGLLKVNFFTFNNKTHPFMLVNGELFLTISSIKKISKKDCLYYHKTKCNPSCIVTDERVIHDLLSYNTQARSSIKVISYKDIKRFITDSKNNIRFLNGLNGLTNLDHVVSILNDYCVSLPPEEEPQIAYQDTVESNIESNIDDSIKYIINAVNSLKVEVETLKAEKEKLLEENLKFRQVMQMVFNK